MGWDKMAGTGGKEKRESRGGEGKEREAAEWKG